MKASKQIELAY